VAGEEGGGRGGRAGGCALARQGGCWTWGPVLRVGWVGARWQGRGRGDGRGPSSAHEVSALLLWPTCACCFLFLLGAGHIFHSVKH
jgi:hypothetical protein